jgi:nucleoside phosphorylase
MVEETEVRLNGQIFDITPELEDPVTWPSELFRVYPGRDETLERFAAAFTTSTVPPTEYTVGWICAIQTEYVAARVFLDEVHEDLVAVSPDDSNDYTTGKIGEHNVVIAVLPDGEYGKSSAGRVAAEMIRSFCNIRFGLMVGIGGGAPSKKHDIRLGDIVVGSPYDGLGGVFQYDFSKTIAGGNFHTTGFLNQPRGLRATVRILEVQYKMKRHQIQIAISNVFKQNPRLRKKYQRPDSASDRLYRNDVIHPSNTRASCSITCGNEPSSLVFRPERTEDDDNLTIHYGLIASANQLIKDATMRDRLAAERDILCFETEAAGLMNNFPWLVIRGICDYSDSHKNKEWQGYAAIVAAAYAKELLCQAGQGDKWPRYAAMVAAESAKDLLRQTGPNKVKAEEKISDIPSGKSKVLESYYYYVLIPCPELREVAKEQL